MTIDEYIAVIEKILKENETEQKEQNEEEGE